MKMDKEKNMKINIKDPVIKALLKLAIKILGIIIVLILIFTYIFGLHRVNDTSMQPNVNPGDLILYYRLDKKLINGEVVLYEYKGETRLARVVAMQNDTVEIGSKGFTVNGGTQFEPKVFKETLPFKEGIKYPVKLNSDEVFIMADERGNSIDSRLFGPIKINKIKGKVFTLLRRRGI